MTIVLIIIFCILSIIALKEPYKERSIYKNHYVLFIIWILLVLVAMFRPNSMPDYENYYNYFVYGYFERGEFGFKAYVDFFRYITSEPVHLFAIVALLSVGIKLLYINEYSDAFWLSILVYVSCYFILHDLIQIRAAIASGVLLWATKYIYEKKILKFLLCACIAFSFHYSSLVILPLYFLSIRRIHKAFYFLIIPFSYLFVSIGITLGHLVEYIPINAIQNLWSMYQIAMRNNISSEINIFNVLQLLRCGMCYFLLFHIDVISKYNRMAVLWVKMYAISIASLVLLSDVPVMSFRISELYQIVEILLIPTIILIPSYRKLGKYIIWIYCCCLFYVNLSSIHQFMLNA